MPQENQFEYLKLDDYFRVLDFMNASSHRPLKYNEVAIIKRVSGLRGWENSCGMRPSVALEAHLSKNLIFTNLS